VEVGERGVVTSHGAVWRVVHSALNIGVCSIAWATLGLAVRAGQRPAIGLVPRPTRRWARDISALQGKIIYRPILKDRSNQRRRDACQHEDQVLDGKLSL
jgi:hypothetical protein